MFLALLCNSTHYLFFPITLFLPCFLSGLLLCHLWYLFISYQFVCCVTSKLRPLLDFVLPLVFLVSLLPFLWLGSNCFISKQKQEQKCFKSSLVELFALWIYLFRFQIWKKLDFFLFTLLFWNARNRKLWFNQIRF